MALSEEVTPRWQASKSTLYDRISYLFCNELYADVHFIVGRDDNQQSIPAHKLVLSTGSAVFDAMLNGGLANNDSIDVTDVEPPAFLALLRFLYCDQVDLEEEDVIDTLYAAHKYDVPVLEKLCADFLEQNLCADNALSVLPQARLFGQTELEQRCLEIIDKQTLHVLASQDFTDVDRATLSVVLSRDALYVNELHLFETVCRWAEAECNRNGISARTADEKRAALGELIRLIRFPLMTDDEFASGPGISGILSDEECYALITYFHSSPKPSIAPFNDSSRHFPGIRISRFAKTSIGWSYNHEYDKIMFTVDRAICITGFGFYGASRACEYKVHIEVRALDSVIASHDARFTCDGSSSVFRVLFPVPVSINARQPYTVSARLEVASLKKDAGQFGPVSRFGFDGSSRVEHSTGSPVFTFHNCLNSNGTTTEYGQIPEIYFYL